MSGFTPLFGGGAASAPADPSPAVPKGRGGDGFAPMFGRASAGAGRPSGFTPLHEAAGRLDGASPEPPPDLEALLQQARDEGAQGARDTMQAELDDLRAQLAAVQPALEQLAALRPEIIRRSAGDVGRIVIGLARRVLGESLAVQPEALGVLVQRAVNQLPDEDEITIRVHPDDVGRVRDLLDERFEESVVGDARITAGCRVEARHAAIDATLDAAMEAVSAAVQTWVGSRG